MATRKKRAAPSLEVRRKQREAALARHAARKAAGLPSPFGLPYITPPDPPAPAAPPADVPPVEVPEPAPAAVVTPPSPPVRILLKDDGTPSLRTLPPVGVVPIPPVDPAPRRAFTAWLRSPAGRDACDPRLSRDAVRMEAELVDRLWVAFRAGRLEGIASTPLAQ